MSVIESLVSKGVEHLAALIAKLIPEKILQVLDNEALEAALDQAVAAIHAMDDLSNDQKRKALAQQIQEICKGFGLADRMVSLLGELIYSKFRLKLGF